MANTDFQFKQFRIAQNRCAMKVGTDGVLLGAWASMGAAAPPPVAADAALRRHTDAARGSERAAVAPDMGPLGETASQPLPPLQILDIGTGTGLVALMLAQRAASREWGGRAFFVTAVEREAAAASQARENAAASPWAAMVTVVEADARSWRPSAPTEPASEAAQPAQSVPASTVSSGTQPAAPLVSGLASAVPASEASQSPAAPCFDIIVCNPPFYVNYLKSPDAARNAARHDDGLSLGDLCRIASLWLKPAPAALNLILPAGREADALQSAARHGLRPLRRCCVFTSPSATAPGRVLLSFVRQSAAPGTQSASDPAEPASVAAQPAGPAQPIHPAAPPAETLRIYSPGTSARYSPEYRALVHPFYLNL